MCVRIHLENVQSYYDIERTKVVLTDDVDVAAVERSVTSITQLTKHWYIAKYSKTNLM